MNIQEKTVLAGSRIWSSRRGGVEGLKFRYCGTVIKRLSFHICSGEKQSDGVPCWSDLRTNYTDASILNNRISTGWGLWSSEAKFTKWWLRITNVGEIVYFGGRLMLSASLDSDPWTFSRCRKWLGVSHIQGQPVEAVAPGLVLCRSWQLVPTRSGT